MPFNLEQAVLSINKVMQLKPVSLCYAHFGCARDALARLRLARLQLLTWGKTIAGCLDRGVSHEGMLEELRKADNMIPRIDRLPADQRDREMYFINNSIRGFVAYFQKFGTEFIRRQ